MSNYCPAWKTCLGPQGIEVFLILALRACIQMLVSQGFRQIFKKCLSESKEKGFLLR